MEFKRIIINRKTICIAVFLIISILLMFVREQYTAFNCGEYTFSDIKQEMNEEIDKLRNSDFSEGYEKLKTDKANIKIFSKLSAFEDIKKNNPDFYEADWKDEEESLRAENPLACEDFDKNKELYTEEYLNFRYKVLDVLEKELEHLNGYDEKFVYIDNQAQSISSVSIFSDGNTSSPSNIEKTVKDYGEIRNTDISIGNYQGITSILNFNFIHFAIFIFIFWIISLFSMEQKTGLSELIYTTKKGRVQLAFKRLLTILFCSAVFTAVIYALLFAVSFFIYGGTGDYSNYVQSVSLLADFTVPMSVWNFILYYVVLKIISVSAFAVATWFTMSAVNNKNIALGVFVILLSVEYVMNYFIAPQSNLAIFKYLNIFSLINPTDIVITYHNIPFFGAVIGARNTLTVFAIAVFAVLSVLCLVIGERKRPISRPNVIEIFLQRQTYKIRSFFQRIIGNLSDFGKELYKIFIIQKGILVIAVLLYIVFSNIPSGKVYYGEVDTMLNEFYATYSDTLNSKSQAYIENLRNEIDTVYNEFIQAHEAYANGECSEDDLQKATNKYNSYEAKRTLLSSLDEQVTHIQFIKGTKGIDAWFVNPFGYEFLLGNISYVKQIGNSVLSLACVVILLSGIFSFERKSKTDMLIRSTKNGRNKIFNKKLISTLCITIFVWAMVYGCEFLGIYNKYGLASFNAPIQSLKLFVNVSSNVSILEYLILMYAVRLILLISSVMVIMLISSYTSYMASILLSGFITLMPSLLSLVGVKIFDYISLSRLSEMNEIVINSGSFTVIILSAVISMVLGALSLFLSHRKWCKT